MENYPSIPWICCYFIILFHLKCATGHWFCPDTSSFCLQWLNGTQNWYRSNELCHELGGELPGKKHLREVVRFASSTNNNQLNLWSSLCFTHGKLQWMGAIPYEETNITIINNQLAHLPEWPIGADKSLCYYFNTSSQYFNDIQSTYESSYTICVANRTNVDNNLGKRPQSRDKVKIKSVSIISLGAEIDWGPIGLERDGYMGVFSIRHKSIRLKCQAEPANSNAQLNYRWLRNNGYMGIQSQVISFPTEESMLNWIGEIYCEVIIPQTSKAFRHRGFYLVLMDTVSMKVSANCTVPCQFQDILSTTTSTIQRVLEEMLKHEKKKNNLKFSWESPVYSYKQLTFHLHIRNPDISHFDVKFVQQIGPELKLLLKSEKITLEILSPCNLAFNNENVTWLSYLGQTVPSGNIVGDPICVDENGEIVTRTCRLTKEMNDTSLSIFPKKACTDFKPRKEEPVCFHGYQFYKGHCYLMTSSMNFYSAISQCWAGWKISNFNTDDLKQWLEHSTQYIQFIQDRSIRFIWVPIRKPLPDNEFQFPYWNWTMETNKWSKSPRTRSGISNIIPDTIYSQCAVYDVHDGKIIFQPCHAHHSMICIRPKLPASVSRIAADQAGNVGGYFCEPRWITHSFILDSGICYRRFWMKEPLSWDQAKDQCHRYDGHLAIAPTHNLRIALEQSYHYYNNKTIVDSWIGLRVPDRKIATFSWVNNTFDVRETYHWQPYNEFSNGYGVSTGISRMWWNSPEEVKFWGFICQKTMTPEWKNHLYLQLQPYNHGNYTLEFAYTPPLIQWTTGGNHVNETLDTFYEQLILLNPPTLFTRNLFWADKLSVTCYLNKYIIRHEMNIQFQRKAQLAFQVPASIPSGELVCEAWLDRPAFPLRSNVVVHRSPGYFAYVIYVKVNNTHPVFQSNHFEVDLEENSVLIKDFLRRFSETEGGRNALEAYFGSSFQSISVIPSLHSVLGEHFVIRYHISFILPTRLDASRIISAARHCNPAVIHPLSSQTSTEMDTESSFFLFLKYCLPLAYGERDLFQFLEIRSTVACPAEEVSLRYSARKSSRRENLISWPRTALGIASKSQQLCLTRLNGPLLRRRCMGNTSYGAEWEPFQLNDNSEIECESSNTTTSALYQMESHFSLRRLDSQMNANLAKLTEILSGWKPTTADVELVISMLQHLIVRSELTPEHYKAIQSILTKIWNLDIPSLVGFGGHVTSDIFQLISQFLVRASTQNVSLNLADLNLEVKRVLSLDENVLQRNPIVDVYNLGDVQIFLPIDWNNFGGKVQLVVTTALVPDDFLKFDVSNQELLYEKDYSDPDQISFLGYFAKKTVGVWIDVKSIPVTKYLTNPVTVSFPKLNPSNLQRSSFRCAVWDSQLNDHHGAWQTSDCWYVNYQGSSHICQCRVSGIIAVFKEDTNFFQLDTTAQIYGCSIFFILMCFLITVIIIFPKYRQTLENRFFLQQVISYTVLLIVYIIQTTETGHTNKCLVLSILFQYFILVSFLWMFLLIIHQLFELTTEAIHQPFIYCMKVSIFTWFLPVVVAILMTIFQKHLYYGVDHYCILQEKISVLGALVPVFVLIFLSFVLIFYLLFKWYHGKIELEYGRGICIVTNNFLLTVAGIFVILMNSLYYSFTLAVCFCISNILLAISFLLTLIWKEIVNVITSSKSKPQNEIEMTSTYGSLQQ